MPNLSIEDIQKMLQQMKSSAGQAATSARGGIADMIEPEKSIDNMYGANMRESGQLRQSLADSIRPDAGIPKNIGQQVGDLASQAKSKMDPRALLESMKGAASQMGDQLQQGASDLVRPDPSMDNLFGMDPTKIEKMRSGAADVIDNPGAAMQGLFGESPQEDPMQAIMMKMQAGQPLTPEEQQIVQQSQGMQY